jgi:hypothetical protein
MLMLGELGTLRECRPLLEGSRVDLRSNPRRLVSGLRSTVWRARKLSAHQGNEALHDSQRVDTTGHGAGPLNTS